MRALYLNLIFIYFNQLKKLKINFSKFKINENYLPQFF